jgi:hypothetical protein
MGDVSGLSSQILKLIGNREVYRQVSAAASENAKRFDFDTTGSAILTRLGL